MKGKNEHGTAVDLKAFLRLLKEKLFIILLAGILCGALALAVTTFFITPQYEAGAKMIVNSNLDDTDVITNDQFVTSQKLVSTYSVIIRSRSVLMPVIDRLGLNMSYEELYRNVTAEPVGSTQIMQICVKDPSRKAAESVLREILAIAPDVIIEAVEAGSVKIVEDTYSAPAPVSPNKSLYTALAMLIGCVLAVMLVTVKYISDDTYKEPGEITDDTGIPVIGMIPRVE